MEKEIIVYVKYEKRKLYIYTNRGRIIEEKGTIEGFMKSLYGKSLITINRSELVNPQYICRCEEGCIKLFELDEQLYVSKYKWKNVKERYEDIFWNSVQK